MTMELTVIAPRTLAEAVEYAKMMAATNMVPKNFVGKPYDIVVATQYGASLGLAPLQALQSIAVINGMPCLWGDGLLSVAMSDSQFAGMDETSTGTIDKGDYAAACIVRRARFGQIQTTRREFTQAMAKRAGLLGKAGPWQQYPERMFQMRARAFAIRDAFADALKGFKSAEEQQDIIDAETRAPAERPDPATVVDVAPAVAAEPEKKPSKGNAAVKAALQSRTKDAAPVVIEGPELVDVLVEAIESAQTMDELNLHWTRVTELDKDDDKKRIRAAGNKRLAELNQASN